MGSTFDEDFAASGLADLFAYHGEPMDLHHRPEAANVPSR